MNISSIWLMTYVKCDKNLFYLKLIKAKSKSSLINENLEISVLNARWEGPHWQSNRKRNYRWKYVAVVQTTEYY